MGNDTTPPNKYPCPKCPLSLPTLTTLQTHYQTTHDPNWTAGYPSQCHTCNRIHTRKDKHDYKRAERHFCLEPCFRQWQHEENDLSRDNPNVTAGNPAQSECAHCGTTITREQYKLNRGDTNRHFCNNTCQGKYRAEHFSGQNHPDWTGGTEFYTAVSTLLSDEPWSEISQKTREQHPVCEMCSEPDGEGRGHQNHSHHIVPVLAGGVHVEELLMTLCPKCHGKVETFTQELFGMERVVIPEHLRHTERDKTRSNANEENVPADD